MLRSKQTQKEYDEWKKKNPTGYPFSENEKIAILSGSIVYKNMFPYEEYCGYEVDKHYTISSATYEELMPDIAKFMRQNNYKFHVHINSVDTQSQPDYPHAHLILLK